jgi:superfamily II DNA or RNA helicase
MKTYGQIELTDNNQFRMSDVPPHVAIMLKHVFQRVAKHDVGPWYFDTDPKTCVDLDWFFQRYPMDLKSVEQDVLGEGVRRHHDTNRQIEELFLPEAKLGKLAGYKPGCGARDYQMVAARLLELRKSLLLGDEVGLSKTHSCIASLLLPDALPAVIVVELQVQRQWANWIEANTNLTTYCVDTTKPFNLPDVDVYIFRYSNFTRWADVLNKMPIGLLAWDEIQSLRRGEETSKGYVSKILSDKAKYRLGLTATPIYNYGIEMWHVLRFIDESVLGEKGEFYREWGEGKIRDPQALGSYLRDQGVFLRRTRKDVGRELPPVTKIVEEIDYDHEVVESAEALARQLAIKATLGSFAEKGQAMRELDIWMRKNTGIAKAETVANYVQILLEAGEPVVLAGWHRDVYDIWLEKLADFNPVMVTGSESGKRKTENIEKFLSGETDLMIMSLRSTAGIDGIQDRCSTVVIGELDWSPGIHHQLIGRLDRDRSDSEVNNVMAIFLVVNEGSDPDLMEVNGLKASESSAIHDPDLPVQPVHNDRSNLQRLVDRYLNKKER